MFIDRDLFPKIVSVLVTHMGDVNQRKTHLNNALYGEAMLNRITWEGPAYEFTTHLVDVVNRHGTVDDIDHLGNRRVRSVGEMTENSFTAAATGLALIRSCGVRPSASARLRRSRTARSFDPCRAAGRSEKSMVSM
ncbi:MAG: hypothetical protein AAFV33_04495, partial [Chloroflexota bacterium]